MRLAHRPCNVATSCRLRGDEGVDTCSLAVEGVGDRLLVRDWQLQYVDVAEILSVEVRLGGPRFSNVDLVDRTLAEERVRKATAGPALDRE